MVSLERRGTKPGDTNLNSTTLKKPGKVIGNFNFTPVRKTLMLKKLNY
jgi:hypothetical protein